MAAASNQNKAKTLKRKLDELDCPYTEDVDDSWITELIFKPGEARIRLLQWLFSKFDTVLNDLLDPQFASVESRMDSRIQRLLYVASSLGLCRYDDVDLIRGAVPFTRQAVFMEKLIDLVYIADSSEDPKNKLFQEPGLVSYATPLDTQVSHDTAFMNTLCASGNLEGVFSTKLNLLPADLQKEVETSRVQAEKAGQKTSRPDFQSLQSDVVKITEDTQRQIELLQDMRKHYKYESSDESKLDAVCKTISLVMSELSQLITGFTYCYENEMRHWCNKTPPTLTQLGPAFKRTHRLLQNFVQMLQNLREIRTSYMSLNREPDVLQLEQSSLLGTVSAGEGALAGLHEVVEVLEESVQHAEPLTSSTAATPRASSLNTIPRSLR